MEAVRFEVRGRVQGVGYRAFVWRSASGLNLRGWVRNRSDATVEVAAVGAPENLDLLERQLRFGPPLARVENVARFPWTTRSGERPAPAGFEIAADA